MPTEMENTAIYQSAADVLAAARGSSLTIDTSAITVNSPAFTIYTPLEQMIDEKLKEYCNSTDKHLDDLEEDIEFLDKMRKDTNIKMAYHDDMIDEFQSKIDFLKDENVQLHKYLNDLQNQIYMLQSKLDSQ